jgi:hypothetical protein
MYEETMSSFTTVPGGNVMRTKLGRSDVALVLLTGAS